MTNDPADAELDWIKSTLSISSGACVQLAVAGDRIALRDSKNPEVKPFLFTRAEIGAFLSGAKRGEFDHLLG